MSESRSFHNFLAQLLSSTRFSGRWLLWLDSFPAKEGLFACYGLYSFRGLSKARPRIFRGWGLFRYNWPWHIYEEYLALHLCYCWSRINSGTLVLSWPDMHSNLITLTYSFLCARLIFKIGNKVAAKTNVFLALMTTIVRLQITTANLNPRKSAAWYLWACTWCSHIDLFVALE